MGGIESILGDIGQGAGDLINAGEQALGGLGQDVSAVGSTLNKDLIIAAVLGVAALLGGIYLIKGGKK
jgi:hypothetical protein